MLVLEYSYGGEPWERVAAVVQPGDDATVIRLVPSEAALEAEDALRLLCGRDGLVSAKSLGFSAEDEAIARDQEEAERLRAVQTECDAEREAARAALDAAQVELQKERDEAARLQAEQDGNAQALEERIAEMKRQGQTDEATIDAVRKEAADEAAQRDAARADQEAQMAAMQARLVELKRAEEGAVEKANRAQQSAEERERAAAARAEEAQKQTEAAQHRADALGEEATRMKELMAQYEAEREASKAALAKAQEELQQERDDDARQEKERDDADRALQARITEVEKQEADQSTTAEKQQELRAKHEQLKKEQQDSEAKLAAARKSADNDAATRQMQAKEQERQAQMLQERIKNLKKAEEEAVVRADQAQKEAVAKQQIAAQSASAAHTGSGARVSPMNWSPDADKVTGCHKVELTNDPKWATRFQELLDGTCRQKTLGAGRDQIIKGGKYDRLVFHKAWRLENSKLYGLYAAHRDHQVVNPKEAIYAKTHDLPTSAWMEDECGLRKKERNECYLWHGTKPDYVDIIATEGFDERVCSLQGLFGAGVYLADEVSKSDQYTTPTPANDPYNGVYHIFLVRGTMGKFEKLSTGSKEARRAPAGCQSVLGQIDQNKYREYIIYDGWLAYPEYIIEYKRQYVEKGVVKKKK
jgi:hypothetical protein